jgi:hypothetical protein
MTCRSLGPNPWTESSTLISLMPASSALCLCLNLVSLYGYSLVILSNELVDFVRYLSYEVGLNRSAITDLRSNESKPLLMP